MEQLGFLIFEYGLAMALLAIPVVLINWFGAAKDLWDRRGGEKDKAAFYEKYGHYGPWAPLNNDNPED